MIPSVWRSVGLTVSSDAKITFRGRWQFPILNSEYIYEKKKKSNCFNLTLWRTCYEGICLRFSISMGLWEISRLYKYNVQNKLFLKFKMVSTWLLIFDYNLHWKTDCIIHLTTKQKIRIIWSSLYAVSFSNFMSVRLFAYYLWILPSLS